MARLLKASRCVAALCSPSPSTWIAALAAVAALVWPGDGAAEWRADRAQDVPRFKTGVDVVRVSFVVRDRK